MAATAKTFWNETASDPAHHAATVTPSDSADLSFVTTVIYVGTAGSMQVTMAGGETVVFPNLPVGWHPIRASRVWATNTAATNIVACWR